MAEGVLALTGYQVPDPIDLIYRPRGLGMRLASNVTAVAPQVPEGEKGRREAGGGGGAEGADVLRSRFQTTAFFLGSVVTDAQGNATATAKLPDNLTTFRVMAVAVTAGDRYGNGQSSMLVTRPLLARQALPRFVRPGDAFTAGAVVNRRDGAAGSVTVRAAATGVSLRGGTGKVPYVVLGALFFGVVENGMNVSGVSSYLQIGVTGLILIFAAVADEFRRRLSVRTKD